MFSKRGLLTSIFFLASLSLALLVGCSQDGGLMGPAGDSNGTTPLSMSLGDRGGFASAKVGDLQPLEENPTNGAWIGVRGGTVVLEFATLEIPAGALSSATYITMERDDPTQATFEFGPHGQQFLLPITIRMTPDNAEGLIQAGSMAPEDYRIAHYDEELEQWVELPSFLELDGDGYSITAKTTHFSRYALSD